MRKKYGLYTAFALGAIFCDTYGYIYHLSVMKKEVNAHEQLIVGIGDYHDKDHPANSDQRAYLESIIKKCRSLESKLIVEDLGSVNSDGKGMCCNFSINSRGGVLGKLADVARAECIDVDNVEYRFCRVAGVGPLINGSDRLKNNSSALIPMQALCDEFLDECSRVRTYNDTTEVNRFYKKIADDVSRAFSSLKIEKETHYSIADYCSRFYKNNCMKNLEKLCIFDSSLIDAKIMHSIVSSPDKSVIIVAAGGSHIEKVNSLLEVIGYKKVTIPVIMIYTQQSVENLLSSGKINKNVYRPSAVNLQALDQFIR